MISCEGCAVFKTVKTEAGGCSGRPGGLDITRRAFEISPAPAAARILDIACGRANTIAFLHSQYNLSAFGTDISFKALRERTVQEADTPVAQADGMYLPFKDGTFDAVILECALSIVDTRLVLRECRRLLKPGAMLFLNDIYVRNPDATAQASLSHTRCLGGLMSQEMIHERLREHHFRLNVWEDQSPALIQWLVDKIFSFGSVDQFYRHLIIPGHSMDDLKMAFHKLKLGYYLLIAEKTV